jgi:hypothetical protein
MAAPEIRGAIACQGGGSHTAFTAGVLRRVLREEPAPPGMSRLQQSDGLHDAHASDVRPAPAPRLPGGPRGPPGSSRQRVARGIRLAASAPIFLPIAVPTSVEKR